jgi:hypothetical protein
MEAHENEPKIRWSLSNLVALLRQQLFVYRDLFTWLAEINPRVSWAS